MKKQNIKISVREKEIIKLKCICLNNNQEYQHYASMFRPEYEKYLVTRSKKDYKALDAVRSEFGIEFPLLPKELNSLVRKNQWIILKRYFAEKLHKNILVTDKPATDEEISKILNEIKRKDPELYKEKNYIITHLKSQTNITVKINLRGNKKKILSEIGTLLRKLEKRAPKEDDLIFCRRSLKTYILKKKKGLTQEALVALNYPNSRNSESALTQVKRECGKAKRLINGGYNYLK